MRDGFGIQNYVDESVYEGEWSEDKPCGWGKMKHFNGEEYTGEFKNGNRHGFGIKTFPDGRVIEAEWIDDQCTGKCKAKLSMGAEYEGSSGKQKKRRWIS